MAEQIEAPLTAPPKHTMRLEEVAARLGCSFQTVRRRVDAGHLRATKRNNRLEFDAEEVESLHANPPSDGRESNGPKPKEQKDTAVSS